MRVVVTSEIGEDYEYENLEIVIDDKFKFSVCNSNDSMEDATLSRNFADCHDIPALLRKAYEAGKNGEEFTVIHMEDEGEEF